MSSKHGCSAYTWTTPYARRPRRGRWGRTTWDKSYRKFDGALSRGWETEAISTAAWVQAMLAGEAALARARGQEELAGAIDGAQLDPRELGERAAESGNPVVPLAEALRGVEGPEAHRGATSQDILDTALMLVARDALAVVRED